MTEVRRRVLADDRDHVDVPQCQSDKDGTRLSSGANCLGCSNGALGHGRQDTQKTMGVIFLALLVSDRVDQNAPIPWWVKVAAASAISLGTYSGGWRIMRTLGRRIIHLDPPRGFASETVAATTLYVMAIGLHAPVSTTHTITSSLMGAGASKRLSAVRWGVARGIVLAWIVTIPMAGLMAAGRTASPDCSCPEHVAFCAIASSAGGRCTSNG